MNAASIKENGHLLATEQNGSAPQRCGSASMLQLSQLQSQRQYSMNSLHRAAVAAAAGCPQPAATGSTFASPIHQQLLQLSPAHGACRYALTSTNPNASPVYVPSRAGATLRQKRLCLRAPPKIGGPPEKIGAPPKFWY